MKSCMLGFLGIALVVATSSGANIGVEFSGLLTNGKEVRLLLTDTTTKKTSWVAVGHEFSGYTVSKYDSADETVVLTKSGADVRLRMNQARTGNGAAEAPPAIKQAITHNLRQLAAAADQYYLENGKNTAKYEDLVGERLYVKNLVIIDGEDYRIVEFAQGRPLQVKTRQGYNITYAP